MPVALLARFNAYRAHPDPHMQAANTFALVLASDGPLYPLYLWFLIGRGFWPSLLPLWVVPVYGLLPLFARRRPQAARVLLVVASIANITLYTLLFGAPAEFQLFLLPCITLSLFFHRRERLLAWALGGVALGLFVALRHDPFGGVCRYSGADYHAIAGLSEVTVATLSWFLMALFGAMFHDARSGQDSAVTASR